MKPFAGISSRYLVHLHLAAMQLRAVVILCPSLGPRLRRIRQTESASTTALRYPVIRCWVISRLPHSGTDYTQSVKCRFLFSPNKLTLNWGNASVPNRLSRSSRVLLMLILPPEPMMMAPPALFNELAGRHFPVGNKDRSASKEKKHTYDSSGNGFFSSITTSVSFPIFSLYSFLASSAAFFTMSLSFFLTCTANFGSFIAYIPSNNKPCITF